MKLLEVNILFLCLSLEINYECIIIKIVLTMKHNETT